MADRATEVTRPLRRVEYDKLVALGTFENERRKLRLYASCGVPEYWVVNIPERCVEVYREARPSCYAQCERYEPGQSIRLASFSDVVIAVADFLR